MIRGDIIGFLYIVHRSRYYGQYRRRLRRIIPQCLIPVVRPRILEQVEDSNGRGIGAIGGILLRESDMEKSELLEKLVMGIKALRQPGMDRLILDELHLFNMDNISYIEDRTGLRVVDGKEVLLAFLVPVLECIYVGLGEELRDKEALILSNGENLTRDTIEAICTKVRFITLAGGDNGAIEGLIEEILNKTGLSIFHSKRVADILPRYSIIINLAEKLDMSLGGIKRRAIVFDFSFNRIMSGLMMGKHEPGVIDDLIFKCNFSSIGQTEWLKDLCPSYIYEYFYPRESGEVQKLSIDGDIYDIEEYIDLHLRNRGKL